MQSLMVFLAGLVFPVLGVMISVAFTGTWKYAYLIYYPVAAVGIAILWSKYPDKTLWLRVGILLGIFCAIAFLTAIDYS